MDRRERVREIIKILSKEFPDADTELKHNNPLELLIATILSAQCTDERVNKITENLFKKYKTVEDYANVDINKFENEIKSTGFYKNKARNIKRCCQMIIEKFNGKIPKTMDELLTLPGVARKTANIVLGHGYGIVEGIAVDTHVMRLAQRLGLTKEKDRNRIERDLMEVTPKRYWILLSDILILHGRKTCNARNPKCDKCSLNSICPSAFKFDR